MTYHQLDGHEARSVEVQTDDGLWIEGFLRAYRKVEGVWSGYVEYSSKPGETYVGWFEEGRIRGHAVERG